MTDSIAYITHLEAELKKLSAENERLKEQINNAKKLLPYVDQASEIIHKKGCTYPCTCGLVKIIANIAIS